MLEKDARQILNILRKDDKLNDKEKEALNRIMKALIEKDEMLDKIGHDAVQLRLALNEVSHAVDNCHGFSNNIEYTDRHKFIRSYEPVCPIGKEYCSNDPMFLKTYHSNIYKKLFGDKDVYQAIEMYCKKYCNGTECIKYEPDEEY